MCSCLSLLLTSVGNEITHKRQSPDFISVFWTQIETRTFTSFSSSTNENSIGLMSCTRSTGLLFISLKNCLEPLHTWKCKRQPLKILRQICGAGLSLVKKKLRNWNFLNSERDFTYLSWLKIPVVQHSGGNNHHIVPVTSFTVVTAGVIALTRLVETALCTEENKVSSHKHNLHFS